MRKFEIPEDLKSWYAISCPTTGVRFDARTFEFLDTDKDGRVRADEVKAALAYLAEKGVDVAALQSPSEEDGKKLADVLARLAELDKAPPSEADKKAFADWEAAGKASGVAVCGEGTAAAEAALAAVEPTIDAFFTPPEDMPLVTEAADVELPLRDHLNPKHLEAILAFASKCVTPVLGEKTVLTRLDWKAVKAAFAPYRAWIAAKPVASAPAKDALVEEEKILRYKLHLGELLDNYVTMDRLYSLGTPAIFQTGILRIDGKELSLCFHVDSEAAHSGLVGRSKCCVIYVKLTRPAEGATRQICAVVTAGTVAGLYVGRNGVFCDRDGKDWEAVITKVVEAEVSLAEAFWSPWRKLGESVAGIVKKFLGEKQAKSTALVSAPAAAPAKEGGAAMASSVAAIGIGVGMLGAAAASLMAVLSSMTALQIAGSVLGLILVISLPSVILTWFNLRRRDLGAILNACGWAGNREMRFSMRLARTFTKGAKGPSLWPIFIVVALLFGAIGGLSYWQSSCQAEAPAGQAK